MSNYVWNKVVCRKDILDQYFIDHDPFGNGSPVNSPYVSFNRLFSVKSLDAYSEKYGVRISYGEGFSWDERPDGLYEVKFCTRWEYPIRAIVRTLELAHDTLWYAFEENRIYVSCFYWADCVKEKILFIEDEFWQWHFDNLDYDDSIEEPDDGVWHFLPTATGTWQNWESRDGFSRYLDKAAIDAGEQLRREFLSGSGASDAPTEQKTEKNRQVSR